MLLLQNPWRFLKNFWLFLQAVWEFLAFFVQRVLVLLLATTVRHEKLLQFLFDLFFKGFSMKTFLSHLSVYSDHKQKSWKTQTAHSPQLHKHKIDMIYFWLWSLLQKKMNFFKFRSAQRHYQWTDWSFYESLRSKNFYY